MSAVAELGPEDIETEDADDAQPAKPGYVITLEQNEFGRATKTMMVDDPAAAADWDVTVWRPVR